MKLSPATPVVLAALLSSIGSVSPMAANPCAASQESEEGDALADARAELGDLLFREQLFTNPASDFQASCASCHQTAGTQAGRAKRVWADYTSFSMTAQTETTARNTPTINGPWTKGAPLGWAGGWTSMEELVREKLLGPINGWKPEDLERAKSSIHFTLVEEGSGGGAGPDYVERFKTAWDVDISKLSIPDTIDSAVRALAAYTREIESTTSRWDAFATQNRLRPAPNPGETPDNYAFALESRIGNQEGRRLIRRPEGMSQEAYEGFKTFFRVYGEEDQPIGNCVACHVPPRFTDDSFHVIGTAALQYERVHGEGSWAEYDVPATPSSATALPATAGEPSRADLGYWNHAPEAERDQWLGAFKTPPLRNLSGTDPYFHDGSLESLEEVVRTKIAMAEFARSEDESAQGLDPELRKINLSDEDIAPLVAFLRTLDDVGKDNFRHYLIHFEDN